MTQNWNPRPPPSDKVATAEGTACDDNEQTNSPIARGRKLEKSTDTFRDIPHVLPRRSCHVFPIQSLLGGKGATKCPFCPRVNPDRRQLKMHMARVHLRKTITTRVRLCVAKVWNFPRTIGLCPFGVDYHLNTWPPECSQGCCSKGVILERPIADVHISLHVSGMFEKIDTVPRYTNSVCPEGVREFPYFHYTCQGMTSEGLFKQYVT